MSCCGIKKIKQCCYWKIYKVTLLHHPIGRLFSYNRVIPYLLRRISVFCIPSLFLRFCTAEVNTHRAFAYVMFKKGNPTGKGTALQVRYLWSPALVPRHAHTPSHTHTHATRAYSAGNMKQRYIPDRYDTLLTEVTFVWTRSSGRDCCGAAPVWTAGTVSIHFLELNWPLWRRVTVEESARSISQERP